MVIVFFDSFIIVVFLLFALGLVYEAYLTLHGIIFTLTIIFFLAITILTVLMMIVKVNESLHCAMDKPLIIWNLFLSLISSIVSLYTCYLFMSDLRAYDDGLWGMIGFIIGIVVGGTIWLASIVGWIQAICIDHPASFNYRGFLLELIAAGGFYALVN